MRVRERESEIKLEDMGLRGSPERGHPRKGRRRTTARGERRRGRRREELYNYCEVRMTAAAERSVHARVTTFERRDEFLFPSFIILNPFVSPFLEIPTSLSHLADVI